MRGMVPGALESHRTAFARELAPLADFASYDEAATRSMSIVLRCYRHFDVTDTLVSVYTADSTNT